MFAAGCKQVLSGVVRVSFGRVLGEGARLSFYCFFLKVSTVQITTAVCPEVTPLGAGSAVTEACSCIRSILGWGQHVSEQKPVSLLGIH